MSVRAKFRVSGKGPATEEGVYVRMVAVIDGSPENKEFFKYTPAGELTLQTINQAAADQLELDKEYYLDITPAN
jgi:hypothetical protein